LEMYLLKFIYFSKVEVAQLTAYVEFGVLFRMLILLLIENNVPVKN
jgi:hypothetical protein